MTPGFKTIPNEPDDIGLRCVNYTLPYILLKKERRKYHTVNETHPTTGTYVESMSGSQAKSAGF